MFTKVQSPASWTAPTFISVFTSMHPGEHKIMNKSIEYDKVNNKIIQAHLKIYGYATDTTPFLTSLISRNGIIFKNAITPAY